MTTLASRHVAPEMLALLLLEAALAFGLAYAASGGVRGANQAVVVAATVGSLSVLLGLYRPRLFLKLRGVLVGTAVGGVLAFPAVWAALTVLDMRDWLAPGWPWGRVLLVWLGALLAVRLGMLLLVRSKLFVRRVAVIGPPGEAARSVAAIRASHAGVFEAVTAPMLQPGRAARLAAHGVSLLIMQPGALAALSPGLMRECRDSGLDLQPGPLFWERHLRRVDVMDLAPGWSAALDVRPAGRLQPMFNRAGDLGLSLGLLLFTLPLMLLMALLVRVESPGPVLYRQERVGLGGRAFVVLKFRSMRADAEARGPAWAQLHDPRVTRLGAFMRRNRIDELPQLWNVLRGQMSFIGPRPERPHFVEQLAGLIPHYRERSRVKPGLTGWAQVNYPYGASVEDAAAKLSYDLYYVRHRSVLLDLSILVATVRVILFQEGSR